MTLWRILLTKLIKQTQLTQNYVYRDTGIWIDTIEKPRATFVASKKDDISKIETFCAQQINEINFHKYNCNSLKSNTNIDKFIDVNKIVQNCNCINNNNTISLNKLKSYIREYTIYRKNIFLANQLIEKFCETFWKTSTMFFVSAYGVYALHDKKFVYNSRYLFGEFPQNMTREIEIYYYLSMGYHGHRLIWQYFDHVRIDFLANFIHHYVTMLLILCSYYFGFTEIGCYVMMLHDNTDFFLSGSKISDYLQYPKIKLFCFVMFFLSWFVGRMGIFMFCIILPCFQMYYICSKQYWYVYYPFFIGLAILWLLHCYWARLILKVLHKLVFKKTLKDNRSDDEINTKSNNKSNNNNNSINQIPTIKKKHK